MRIQIVSAIVLAFAAFACGGTDAGTTGDEADIKSASTKIVGTWKEDANGANLFYSYTFNANGTYDATGGCNPDPAPGEARCFAITRASGKWTIMKSGPQLGAPGGVPELVLTDTFNQKDTYFYSVDAKTLSLSTVFRGQASTFQKQ
jgi:hypothetical protein